MRIIADKYIPYLSGLLEQYAVVLYAEPESVTPALVRDADCLIVRTRTRCDRQLLEGSRVRLILTATIGYDHIDTDYCREAGIAWHNAPGCNADGVCDYVESALLATGTLLQGSVLGIVGVGEVGGRVCRMARERGMRVLLCDPPRAEREGAEPFVSIEDLARKSDVITLHPALSRTGKYPSWHLIDEALLRRTKPTALIINAARGGVVDEQALIRSGRRCVIDCWENEPHINPDMLCYADYATCHIAGYTRWGKYRATDICLRELTRFFDISPIRIPKEQVPEHCSTVFDLTPLSEELKAKPQLFELLRKNYRLR